MAHEFQLDPSGRAKCRACKQPITKGTLRLGEEVPNAFGEGEARHWYHLRCGALRRPGAFLDAEGAALEELRASLPEPSVLNSLREAADLGKTFPRLSRFVRVEEASSGRAKCQGCREVIEKGALRFVLERIEDGMVGGAGFVHIACAHGYAGAADGILERVQGSAGLVDEHWVEVRRALVEQEKLPRVPPSFE